MDRSSALHSTRSALATAPKIQGTAFAAVALLALFFLPPATRAFAEGERPTSRDAIIPTLESLRSVSLPPGHFHGWCGDRAIMTVDGRLVIYDGQTRSSPISYSSTSVLNCGDDGQRLVLVDEDAGWPEKTGLVSEIDIATGAVTRKLAVFQKEPRPIISVSPDLKNVATTGPLTLAADVGALNVIQLRASEERFITRIRWNRDSSGLFAVSRTKKESEPQFVEVFDKEHQKVGSGPLPAGFYLRDGWFIDSQTLRLYVGLKKDEFGVGIVLRCRIDSWTCIPVAKDVLAASAGEGTWGTVKPIGKYSNDGEWITIPSGYLVEIRESDLKLVARQTLKSSEKDEPNLAISPSGSKVVLTWINELDPACPVEKNGSELCEKARTAGTVIDLPRELK